MTFFIKKSVNLYEKHIDLDLRVVKEPKSLNSIGEFIKCKALAKKNYTIKITKTLLKNLTLVTLPSVLLHIVGCYKWLKKIFQEYFLARIGGVLARMKPTKIIDYYILVRD